MDRLQLLYISGPYRLVCQDLGQMLCQTMVWWFLSSTQNIRMSKRLTRRLRIDSLDKRSIGMILFIRTMLMKELLPAPLGPSMPKHSPWGKARDNPLTASLWGFPSLPEYTFFRLLHKTAQFPVDSSRCCSTFFLWYQTKMHANLTQPCQY